MRYTWVLVLFFFAAAGVSGDLLWDNGGPDNRNAILCVYLQHGGLEYEVVDDFDVGDPGWLVTEGHFSLVTPHPDGPDAILAVRVFFYEDDGNKKPLTDRYAEKDCQFTAYETGEYYDGKAVIAVDVTFDQVPLAPGKWWVCFQPEFDHADSDWLTSASKFEGIWIGWAGPYYPKWTKGYDAYGEHYDVSFTLSGEYGSYIPPDAVIDLPTEDVTIEVGQFVEFAGTATDDGYIVDWLWTFGEGSGIDDMHVEDPGPAQFNNVGVFAVTFDAQDDDGNWDPDPDQRTITVLDICPDAVIDLPADDVEIAEGDFVEFAGTAEDGNGYIVEWLWTFGEGSGIEDMGVEDPGPVQFNNVGVFAVTFNAKDNDDNWDPEPDTRTVTVHEASPDAVIDKPRGDVAIAGGESVEFAGTATDWDGWIEDWLWTFGEGSGIEDMHVEDPGWVQFNNIGVFTVTFNARDNDANWDPEPDTRTIYVRNEGAQVYVDQNAGGSEHDGTSWDTAFLTIQDGVDAATPGGEVWVADGDYAENVVMGEAVQLFGGFLGAEPGGYEESLEERNFIANITKIDANQSGSCVVMAVAARIDGFTITGGDAQHGPGIHCSDLGDSGVIANNNITGNYGHSYGGGIYLVRSSPTVTYNQIVGNTATTGGAVMCWTDSSPIISHNFICGNWSTSEGTGGIHLDTSGDPTSPVLTHNMMVGNHAFAGGAVLINNSNPVIANNTMACNEAMYGGAVYAGGSPAVFTNNTIVDNTADKGGGLFFEGEGGQVISNNIVAANVAYVSGGGIYTPDPMPGLSHNNFWGNSPDDYYGCDPGEGDISADPMLVDLGAATSSTPWAATTT